MSRLPDSSDIGVGLLFEYGTLNGGEHSLLAAVDELRTAFRFAARCPAPSPLADELTRREIPVEPTAASGETCSIALAEFVDRHRLHLLHANSLTMARRLGGVTADLPCPASGHLRDIIKLSSTNVTALRQLRGLVAVSEATRRYHVLQGLDPEAVTTIHNGIDAQYWAPRPRTGALHHELHLSKTARFLISIGQICLRKGQRDLAEAFVAISRRWPEAHLLLIGARHSQKPESVRYDEDLDLLFAQQGIADRVHRLGIRNDIPRLLTEADILVHSARQEPFGRVLLEAAAMGTAILATDVGGTTEMLAHRRTAWLVPAAAPVELAQGMNELLGNEALRSSLGAAARADVVAKFDVRLAAARLTEFWRSIADQDGSMPLKAAKQE